jgi:RsiW-degrading membrane proteinase PrsW (M82 family)
MTFGHGALLGVLAVLPAALLVRYFHTRDPDPRGKPFTRAAFYGSIALLVAVGPVWLWSSGRLLYGLVVAPLELPPDPAAWALAKAMLLVALPEELLKLLILLAIAGNRRLFADRVDGIAYGAMVALGFAALENVAFVAGGGLQVALLRSVTAVPAHAIYGAIIGYYVAQARIEGRRRHLLTGLAAAVVLHTAYDFPLMGLKEVARFPLAPTSDVGVWVALTFTVPGAVVLLGAAWVWLTLRELQARGPAAA